MAAEAHIDGDYGVMSSSPARLSLLLPTFAGGGAQRVFITLADELQGRGHDVELVVGQSTGQLLPEVVDRVPHVDLGADRMRSALPQLLSYLRRRRPDCLLATIDHANVLALIAGRFTRTPTIARVANMPPDQTSNGAARTSWTMGAARRLYRRAPFVVAPSRGLADAVAEFATLPREQVRVLYNPVVDERLFAGAREPVDHPWFAPGAAPVILGVARFIPQKDLGTLI